MNYLPIRKSPFKLLPPQINQSLLFDSDFSLRPGAYVFINAPIYYPQPYPTTCRRPVMNNLYQIIHVQNSTVYLTDKRTRFPKIYYTNYPNNIPNISYEYFGINVLHFIEKLNGITSSNMQRVAMKNEILVNQP